MISYIYHFDSPAVKTEICPPPHTYCGLDRLKRVGIGALLRGCRGNASVKLAFDAPGPEYAEFFKLRHTVL